MAQVPTTIRMDSELKRKFDCLCEEFGMSINTAFNIFAKAVVRSRSIPFRIELDDTESPSAKAMRSFQALRVNIDNRENPDNRSEELSLDEINAEINDYRRAKGE